MGCSSRDRSTSIGDVKRVGGAARAGKQTARSRRAVREPLALSAAAQGPVPGGPITIPPGDSTIGASYTSNEQTRIEGLVVMGLSALVGGALLIAGSMQESNCEQHSCSVPGTPLLLGGGGVLVGGGVLGVRMANVSDTASVQIFPGLHPPPAAPEGPAPVDPHARLNAPGLVQRGTF